MQSLNETSSSSSSCHATPTTTTTTASHRKRKHVELSVNFAKGEVDTQTPHEVQSSDDNNQETDTTIPRSLARNNGLNNHDSNPVVEESSEESEDLFRADSEDDNGDNKSDDDDEEEEKAPVFDAKKFFQTPRFRPKEMIEIKKRIKAALEKPMKRLEEGGKEVYLEYLRQKWKRSADATNVNLELRKARLQQQIMDATIQGDPRGYQQTLFEIAKEKNTIINRKCFIQRCSEGCVVSCRVVCKMIGRLTGIDF